MQFFSIFFAVLAVGFASESAGLYAHEFNNAMAVVLLLVSAAMSPALARRTAPPADGRPALWPGVLAVIIGLVLVPAPQMMRFFGLALWFWGIARIGTVRRARSDASEALAIGAVALGFYHLASSLSLVGWYQTQALAPELSALARTLTDKPIEIGPTFNVIAVVVFAVGCCLGGAWIARRAAYLRLLCGLALLTAVYVGYLCLFAVLDPNMLAAELPRAGWLALNLDWLTWLHPLRIPLVGCVGVAVAVALTWQGGIEPEPHRSSVFSAVAVVIAFCGIIAVVLQLNWPAAPRADVKVALYEHGFINWLKPTHDRPSNAYGSRSSGMFGNLEPMMGCMGWSAERIDTISAATLDAKDILVIINQKEPLPEQSLADISQWVQRGGSLLVLGDHTFVKNGVFSLNEPLEDSAIRVVNDSADYFIGGWLHSLGHWPHQTSAFLHDATNEAGCVVGASLDIQYPATPLVIGRYGYSDPADMSQPQKGFLGTLEYESGERLGDIVLVAGQDVGAGKIAVVGDTSGFVNAIQTQTWPFTQRVFSWLGSAGRAAVSRWRDICGLGLFIIVFSASVALSRRSPFVVPIVCLAMCAATYGARQVLTTVGQPRPLASTVDEVDGLYNVAVVDLSHNGRHSLEGWRETAINGVYLNLMRDQWFAIGSKTFDADQIKAARLFVSIAPTQPYTAAEVAVLEDFMEAGGTVVVAADWEDRHGAGSLMALAGAELVHKPLGRAQTNVPGSTVQPAFWRAWPVRGDEHCETWVALRDEPVVVRRAVGSGQMIIIGDGEFLLNKNLEKEEGAILSNVQFFRWLLTRIPKSM